MKYKKDYGTCQAPAITDQDGVFVAMMFNEGEESNQLDEAEAEKALSLFVAAPELLEALKSLADICEDEDMFPLSVEHARTAINKAEGKN